MRSMAALIIFCLSVSNVAVAVEVFPASSIMLDMDACSDALRSSCFLPGLIALCPVFTLFFPFICPFACLFYPVYRIPDYLFPLGWIIMLVMTGLVPCSGLVARVAAFIPSTCFVISSVLNTLLAYPLTQTMCCLAPFSLIPVLFCSPVHQTMFSALACIPRLYYPLLFPIITSLREEISEVVFCLEDPFCNAMSFNIEHIPSYAPHPDFYCVFLGCFFRCMQSAITPLFIISSLLCCPIIAPSLCTHISINLPLVVVRILKFFGNDIPKLMNPQNTCLPTYPGLFP